VAVSAAVWVSVMVWRPAPVPPVGRATEVAGLLRDVSTVMFSVSGDPSALEEVASPGQPGTAEALDRGCDPGVWWNGSCSGLSAIPGATLGGEDSRPAGSPAAGGGRGSWCDTRSES